VRRIRPWIVPGLVWVSVRDWVTRPLRTMSYHRDTAGSRWNAARPTPVQVDGDYIGEHTAAELTHVPAALDVIA
jgi:hypothetical protein